MDTQEKDYPVSIMEEGDGKKTKRKPRRFSAEFKKSAVALVLDGGRTIEAVVDDLGLTRSSFCTWLTRKRCAKQ
jgi:transposase-like protein